MINEDLNSSTRGRADSGCLVLLELHHFVERFADDLFGYHPGGHFTDPPRLIVEHAHQRWDGIV